MNHLLTVYTFLAGGRSASSSVMVGRAAAAWMCSSGPLAGHTHSKSSAICACITATSQSRGQYGWSCSVALMGPLACQFKQTSYNHHHDVPTQPKHTSHGAPSQGLTLVFTRTRAAQWDIVCSTTGVYNRIRVRLVNGHTVTGCVATAERLLAQAVCSALRSVACTAADDQGYVKIQIRTTFPDHFNSRVHERTVGKMADSLRRAEELNNNYPVLRTCVMTVQVEGEMTARKRCVIDCSGNNIFWSPPGVSWCTCRQDQNASRDSCTPGCRRPQDAPLCDGRGVLSQGPFEIRIARGIDRMSMGSGSACVRDHMQLSRSDAWSRTRIQNMLMRSNCQAQRCCARASRHPLHSNGFHRNARLKKTKTAHSTATVSEVHCRAVPGCQSWSAFRIMPHLTAAQGGADRHR